MNSVKKNQASRIAVWTLGCSKNTYDSEQLIQQIGQAGYRIVDMEDDPNVVIINTCGFIDVAKEESIEAIMEACSWKEKKQIDKVVAMGCLVQRYKNEISENIPELDGVFGVEQFDQMLEFCRRELVVDERIKCNTDVNLKLTLTPAHWSYIKDSTRIF